jgi:putative zinc ribbon protein
MTSSERKHQRLKESQLARAKALAHVDPADPDVEPPAGAVMAEPANLSHNNTYGRLPRFYIDRVVICRQCGKEEVWPAERQKWWYEEAKGNINTQAVLCRSCRSAEKERKARVRDAAQEGIRNKRKHSET